MDPEPSTTQPSPTRPPTTQALSGQAMISSFLDADGRLIAIPRRHTRRMAALDHIARVFEPGRRYPEVEVNAMLRAFHDDVAALRRYLVDHGFMARENSVYWRAGGTVDV